MYFLCNNNKPNSLAQHCGGTGAHWHEHRYTGSRYGYFPGFTQKEIPASSGLAAFGAPGGPTETVG